MTPRDYLARLEFHGIKLGLDNIRLLMEAAGNPQSRYPTIHVAGTNGKGSVVAFTGAILQATGCRVGRFTSPHLSDVSERFLINGDPIADADLDRHIEFFRVASDALPNPPTYFEVCTAIALRHFAENCVDVAVIEVGMGGRFDSTNIIQPEVCAITNIAMDHMNYLGDTIEAIAFEKAGIIKPGVPVVVGERLPAPFDVIQSAARERNAPLLVKGRDFTYTAQGVALAPAISYRGSRFQLSEVPICLAGMHQVENAALAIATIESIQSHFPVSTDSIASGLAAARWPCRLERVCDNPPVYIDIAHNPAAIQRLVESMPRCVVVFAASSDKNAGEMIHALQPIAHRLILTTFSGPRAATVEQLAKAAGAIEHERQPSLDLAIETGIARLPAAHHRIDIHRRGGAHDSYARLQGLAASVLRRTRFGYADFNASSNRCAMSVGLSIPTDTRTRYGDTPIDSTQSSSSKCASRV